MNKFLTLFPALHFFLTTVLALVVQDATLSGQPGRTGAEALTHCAVALGVGGAPFVLAAWWNYRAGRSTRAIFVAGFFLQWLAPVVMVSMGAHGLPLGRPAWLVLGLEAAVGALLASPLVGATAKETHGWKLALGAIAGSAWLLILAVAIGVLALDQFP